MSEELCDANFGKSLIYNCRKKLKGISGWEKSAIQDPFLMKTKDSDLNRNRFNGHAKLENQKESFL